MSKLLVLVPLTLVAMTTLASAQVGGSYQRSCENIRQRGPYLSADCDDVNGETHRTSIDVRGCRGGVNNSNGRLTCTRGGYGGDNYGEPQRRRFYDPQSDDNSDDSSD